MSLLGERQHEEALDVFMEGLVIAERRYLGDRILSTFHDHVAHTILQLRQQRALHTFALVSHLLQQLASISCPLVASPVQLACFTCTARLTFGLTEHKPPRPVLSLVATHFKACLSLLLLDAQTGCTFSSHIFCCISADKLGLCVRVCFACNCMCMCTLMSAHAVLLLRTHLDQRGLCMHQHGAVRLQTNGDRVEISWRHAEEHARTAVKLGRRCTPSEAAMEASPLTTMGDIASAMCRFPLAKQRCAIHMLNCVVGDMEPFWDQAINQDVSMAMYI